jgi:hypothetical protein
VQYKKFTENTLFLLTTSRIRNIMQIELIVFGGKFSFTVRYICRSRWPSCLRRGSADDRLLGLQVRIPPGAWMFICCKCCVYSQVEVLATG